MITIVFVLVIIAIVATFSVQNAGSVVVSFLSWRFEASLAIVIVLCVLIGIIIGAAIALFLRRKTAVEKKVKLP